MNKFHKSFDIRYNTRGFSGKANVRLEILNFKIQKMFLPKENKFSKHITEFLVCKSTGIIF